MSDDAELENAENCDAIVNAATAISRTLAAFVASGPSNIDTGILRFQMGETFRLLEEMESILCRRGDIPITDKEKLSGALADLLTIVNNSSAFAETVLTFREVVVINETKAEPAANARKVRAERLADDPYEVAFQHAIDIVFPPPEIAPRPYSKALLSG